MKATRHAKILELIQNHTVTTQEELQSLLEANGFYATQATISRDIRDLRLVKVLSPSGIYYYTQSNTAPADTLQLSGDSVRFVFVCWDLASGSGNRLFIFPVEIPETSACDGGENIGSV